MSKTSQERNKMRLLHSPQSSFGMKQMNGTDKLLVNYGTTDVANQLRSQSSSRQSNNLRTSEENQKQMRTKHINEALNHIDSIFSSLMTPVHRRNKCVCGSGSKCNCNDSKQNDLKTCKSDNNNFTSCLDSRNTIGATGVYANQALTVKVLSSQTNDDVRTSTQQSINDGHAGVGQTSANYNQQMKASLGSDNLNKTHTHSTTT